MLIFFLGLIAAPAAFGQSKDSPIAFSNTDGITTTFVTAPNLAGTGGSASGDNQWLKVEFRYGTTPVLKANYVDAVEFKVWIEGLDLLDPNAPVKGKGVAVALTGSVTYVNIPMGKDIYGVVYVHPSTLGRYCERSYTDFERKFNIHIEALIGGAEMDHFDKNREKDPNWFQPLKPITGLVYLQNQTPFIIADPDRYPGIKLPAATP